MGIDKFFNGKSVTKYGGVCQGSSIKKPGKDKIKPEIEVVSKYGGVGQESIIKPEIEVVSKYGGVGQESVTKYGGVCRESLAKPGNDLILEAFQKAEQDVLKEVDKTQVKKKKQAKNNIKTDK